MATYNLPGDPYNQQDVGWDVDSDKEPFEDSESSGTDTELQIYNPPQAGPHPVARQDFQGPIPMWGEHLNHWSQQEGLRPPYGMARGYYELYRGDSANKALPVIVKRIARQTDQAQISINRIIEVNAIAQTNTADILHLDELQDDTQNHTKALQRQMNDAQAEIKALREYHATQERYWKNKDEAESSNRRSTHRR